MTIAVLRGDIVSDVLGCFFDKRVLGYGHCDVFLGEVVVDCKIDIRIRIMGHQTLRRFLIYGVFNVSRSGQENNGEA